MTLRAAAVDLAAAGWEVFPLNGKVPLFPNAHRDGDPLRGQCHGDCGRVGHGLWDATTDVGTVAEWWRRHPRANIGARVPAMLVVVDVDPRHGGNETLAELEHDHGRLPPTLTTITGSDGRHLWFVRPAGDLVATIGAGLDVKTCAGYCVMPPSEHPDTGRPYRWADPDVTIAQCPGWLTERLRRPVVKPPNNGSRHGSMARLRHGGHGDGPADRFNDAHRWADVLGGWHLVAGDGESDGSTWRHPAATAASSATVRHGLLFVYSPNAGLPVTEPSHPAGLTKFRAWAHLEHRGDLSAAAHAYRESER